jgi:hypothetical protein
MEKAVRKYNVKDVDLLVSSETIIDSAIAHKVVLQGKRSTWADPFFDNLKATINKALEDHLGVDNAKQLRESTKLVGSIQADAIKDLAEVKVQIVQDFKDDKTLQKEIETQLGFSSYHAAAQKKNQEALINLLYQFKTNLTPDLKAKIIKQGTAPILLDQIVGYANTLKAANVEQEGSKGTRKEISNEGVVAFNSIYDAVVSICKISSKFFKQEPAIQQQFSFAKVTKTLGISKKAAAKKQ